MSRSFLVFITLIIAVIVFTQCLTLLIEMNVHVANVMYSAGHNFGNYLKDVFNYSEL